MKQAVQKTMRRRPGHHDHGSRAVGRQQMGRGHGAKARSRGIRCAPISITARRANTTFGVIGVKVWVYLGEVMPGEEYHARYSVEAG